MTAFQMHVLVSWPLWFAAVVITGFLLAVASCALLLPLLRTLKVRQRAYEVEAATHQLKTGTPTRGGVCFVGFVIPLCVPG